MGLRGFILHPGQFFKGLKTPYSQESPIPFLKIRM